MTHVGSLRRIGLLLVGHVDPNSQHIGGDYPELFANLLAGRGIELVPYALDNDQFPSSPRECDGWICSPSRLSAYDDVAYLRDAESLLRSLVAAEVPYVGVCFGHQLLAQALGGTVEKSPGGWGVGVLDYRVVTRRPWMAPAVSSLALIGSHQDQVTALPDGAELLFAADYCPLGGFAVGERAWTIQVHPEFTAPLADHLLAGRYDLIGHERVERARSTLGRPTDSAVVADWIAAFFAA